MTGAGVDLGRKAGRLSRSQAWFEDTLHGQPHHGEGESGQEEYSEGKEDEVIGVSVDAGRYVAGISFGSTLEPITASKIMPVIPPAPFAHVGGHAQHTQENTNR